MVKQRLERCLHTIIWLLFMLNRFKGGAEFYRYMPKEHPSEKIFNVSGVRIMKVLKRNALNSAWVF